MSDEDASLSDFTSEGTAADHTSDGDPADQSTPRDEGATAEKAEHSDTAAHDRAADGTDPTPPTMRYHVEGADCDACGEVVVRRWHDGGAFVCAECRDW